MSKELADSYQQQYLAWMDLRMFKPSRNIALELTNDGEQFKLTRI
ncbi:hypothetical protein [Sphingobacterium faecium]|nr:hypothetical protein [Sphingobacterium faecium]WGQ15068.1 hypothetical protein QG727_01370 [Sphingobacterium faecium]